MEGPYYIAGVVSNLGTPGWIVPMDVLTGRPVAIAVPGRVVTVARIWQQGVLQPWWPGGKFRLRCGSRVAVYGLDAYPPMGNEVWFVGVLNRTILIERFSGQIGGEVTQLRLTVQYYLD